ncbi:ATP-dependent RNA helicase DDX42-like [Diaphorina citri]|uniref:RNA helicase n=1 Tax=Diaphorina citri TaxID=121845 RepID=A0A3Q0J0Q5_DIACI|nr:ATP-dependent RNA helicase DDX42-like [Diaphorina citri]
MEENPNAGLQDNDSDVDLEYDEDGNPIAPKKSKYIDPLPPIDHSTIVYEEVEKNFYQPHEDIARLTPQEAQELRAKSGITVSGADPPYPVSSFGHFGFDEVLMKALRKCEYTSPTPIQAQAVPAALSGRDIIEPQVRSICDHVRPNRQTLLFSATFKKRIEKLARDVLTDPIKIVQGDIGEANTDITQVVINLPQTQKLTWLTHNLVEFLSTGSLLIFVTKKCDQCFELVNLIAKNYWLIQAVGILMCPKSPSRLSLV